MITLYGFGTIFPEGVGETKDLRAQWALEESGLPYRVHPVDHSGGECETDAFGKISPFRQMPILDDGGFLVAESAAIVLYVAEKSGKLLPSDPQGRMRVTQWCFAAVASVEPTLTCLDLIDIFDSEKEAHKVRAEAGKLADRWLGNVERRLEGRTWIAVDEFSAADIMMAGVLRTIRKTNRMNPYPKLQSYYERCFARPAWDRALAMYAERLGVTVQQIR